LSAAQRPVVTWKNVRSPEPESFTRISPGNASGALNPNVVKLSSTGASVAEAWRYA
jgi:hypothetical protein